MPEIMKALFHDFFTFVILIKCHPAGFPILPGCPFLWEKFLYGNIAVQQLVHSPVSNAKTTGSNDGNHLISVF